MTIEQYKEKINQHIGKRDALRTALEAKKKQLKDSKRRLRWTEKGRTIVQREAKALQRGTEEYVSDMVTLALQAVFTEEDLSFELEFEERRGKTEADLWLIEEGERVRPRESTFGGGVIDVASIALRIAIWSLSRKTRNTIILDEPFSSLKDPSGTLQKQAREMLVDLSRHPDIQLQIIMISHDPDIQEGGDRIFDVTKVGGISQVEVL